MSKSRVRAEGVEGKRRVLCPSSARVWGKGREQACCPAVGACSEKPVSSAKPQQEGEMLEGCLLENRAGGEQAALPFLCSSPRAQALLFCPLRVWFGLPWCRRVPFFCRHPPQSLGMRRDLESAREPGTLLGANSQVSPSRFPTRAAH